MSLRESSHTNAETSLVRMSSSLVEGADRLNQINGMWIVFTRSVIAFRLFRRIATNHKNIADIMCGVMRENLVKLDTIAFGFGSGLDPYVVVDFGRQRKKTKTKSGLNPIFNETFGFDCKDGSNAISIALTDAEKTGKDRVIGIRSVKLEDLMCLPGKRWCDKFRLINPANGQE